VDFRSDSSKKRKTEELDEFEVQVRFSRFYTKATLWFGKTKQQVTVDIVGPDKKLMVYCCIAVSSLCSTVPRLLQWLWNLYFFILFLLLSSWVM
jgi:hypothetical protein